MSIHLLRMGAAASARRRSARGADWAYADTGGTITTAGGYRIHTFTSTGSSSINFTKAGKVEYLVVAGGGGGGGRRITGGGGAGEMAFGVDNVAIGSLDITVGVGGAGTDGPGRTGDKGGNSTFNGITCLGGGGGGGTNGGFPTTGGSGGGGGTNGTDAPNILTGATETKTVGFANPGGNGTFAASIGDRFGGGGGGAGGQGQNGASPQASGGIGLEWPIGSGVIYATGGKGGFNASPNRAGANAAPNTGNGGEGACSGGADHPGGDGGSGIVIVRYQV